MPRAKRHVVGMERHGMVLRWIRGAGYVQSATATSATSAATHHICTHPWHRAARLWAGPVGRQPPGSGRASDQWRRRRRLDDSTDQHSVRRHSGQWGPRGDRAAAALPAQSGPTAEPGCKPVP
jgi:hypothetical protein